MDRLRLTATVVLASAIVLISAACGGKETVTVTVASGTTTEPSEQADTTPEQDPGDFMKDQNQARALKQWGRVWTTLHPGQQALISSSDFDVCMDKATSEDGSYEIKSQKVVDVYDDPLQLRSQGVPETTSKAVTLKTTYSSPGTDEQATDTDTSHAVGVDGEWKWILNDESWQAFKKHECLDGTPFASGGPPPPPASGGAKPTPTTKVIRFSGNGTKQLPPAVVKKDSTLYWTHSGPYSFSLHDEEFDVDVSSDANKGDTFVPAGTYRFEVSADGDWTITIR